MDDQSTFFSWYLSESDVKLARKRRVDIYCLLVALMSCENDEEGRVIIHIATAIRHGE